MIKLLNTTISSIYFGSSLVKKIYKGSSLLYNSIVSSVFSFDYVYYIMGLTYISEVKNDIYGLHYDLL